MFDNLQTVATRKRRFIALFIDWICISAYLILLLGIMQLVYLLVFNETPTFSSGQTQLISTLTSVIPIIILFSLMEGSARASTFGKRIKRLKISYPDHPKTRSIIRNIVKFLPWQLGHMGVIHGMYHNFNWVAMTLLSTSMLLAFLYIMMVLVRRDYRHVADLIAGTMVVKNNSLHP
ncbi:RDD family protein [Gracilibacillus orientalis]|uniref:RDD family protein n=1 Tax=Gracilibacillus orientalis TaxID=334253 RepID=A0A1I4HQQ1_9BACI|nr:RDD family protein [Gracilibacillus orientalis]SFL44648.1 RDD family protein [Gracilibacillus orientalis]